MLDGRPHLKAFGVLNGQQMPKINTFNILESNVLVFAGFSTCHSEDLEECVGFREDRNQ